MTNTMKNTLNSRFFIKGAVIISCFGGGWFFASAAQWEVPAQDANTLSATAESIQQENPVVYATRQRHPQAPVFALLALGCNVSGGIVLLWVVGEGSREWGVGSSGGEGSREWGIGNRGEALGNRGEALGNRGNSSPPVLQHDWQNMKQNMIMNFPENPNHQHSPDSLSPNDSQFPIPDSRLSPDSLLPTPYSLSPPDSRLPTPYSLLPTPSLPYRDRLQALWDFLLAQHPWLIQLLEATPVIIWGEQRSGKSTLADCVALLRTLLVGHRVRVYDPHAHLNAWSECFYIAAKNYSEIDKGIGEYRQRLSLKANEKTAITTIWDEFTQYQENCNSQKTGDFDFVKSVLSESDKNDEFPLLLSHGNTLTCLGGTSGTSSMIERGGVMIQCFAQRGVTGRAMPAGKILLKGLDKDERGKTIECALALPEWLRPDNILRLFPELLSNSSNSSEQTETNSEFAAPPVLLEKAEEPQEFPEQSNIISITNRLQLSPQQQAILKFAKQKQKAISARDVMRNKYAVLADYSADDIREVFEELERLNLGFCRGEGQSLVFVLKQRGQRA